VYASSRGGYSSCRDAAGAVTFITHVDDLFANIESTTGAGMVRVMGS